MFKKSLVIAGLVAGASLPAGPAYAATLLDLDCDLTTGCLFSGNATFEPASVLEVETAYNTQHIEPPFPATIDLDGLFTTAGSLGGTSGTFTLPGEGFFDFYAVKAGDYFMLYQVSPTTFVDWTTAGIPHPAGPDRLVDASHITAYLSTGAVPEPATWAMMLLGFGVIGGAMRTAKRRQKVIVSYA